MELDITLCDCPAFVAAEDAGSRTDYIEHRNNLQLHAGYCPYCGATLVKGREKVTGVVIRIQSPRYARDEGAEFETTVSLATLKRLLAEEV